MEQIDLTEIAMYKLVQYLIFDDEANLEISSGKWDSSLSSTTFLEKLKLYVKYMASNNYLDIRLKYNIFNILNRIRECCNDKVNDVNEMILQINKATDEDELDLYIYEKSKRMSTKNLKKLNKYYSSIPKEREKFKKEVSDLISYDYLILNSLLGQISEEDYDNVSLPNLGLSIEYFYSLRSLINDEPNLILSEKVIERIKKVLSYNKKNINSSEITYLDRLEIKSETKVFERYL